MIAVYLLAACSGPGDSSALTGGESCTPLTSGTWTVSGAAMT